MKTQLKFICDGANTRRYHTVNTLTTETVGHHSHGVAMLCVMLGGSPHTVYGALVHDLAEHIVGDVPSPSKREFGISEKLDELESRILGAAGFTMPMLSEPEARILKLADLAQGALFCVQEMYMGNRKMKTVFDRYISYAEQMILVGVEKQLFDSIKEIANECE